MSIKRPAVVFDNVTVITNHMLRNARLKPAEKGILAYILSHAAGYDLTIEQALAENDIGYTALNTILKGLTSSGYLRRVRRRTDEGRLGSYDWDVTIDELGRPTGLRVASPESTSVGNARLVATSEDAEFSQVGTSLAKTSVGNLGDKKLKDPKKFKKTTLSAPRSAEGEPPSAEREIASNEEQGKSDTSGIPDLSAGAALDRMLSAAKAAHPNWGATRVRAVLKEALADRGTVERVESAWAECLAHPQTTEPGRFIKWNDAPWWKAAVSGGSTAKTEELPWCGQCDPQGRWIELENGRAAKCPDCGKRQQIPAQPRHLHAVA